MSVLLMSFALVLIIEGIGPFFFPNRWREYLLQIANEPASSIRQIGLALITLGLILLFFLL